MVEKSTQTLGQRYRLDEPIARGGMAVVWRATDMRLGRSVAVKVLHPRLASDANFRERFRREAVAAASFNHPNIITVFDTGEDSDSHFIVMELIEGPSLSRLLGPTGTLTPTETVSMMRAVLSALSYSHDRGVIHRDIKPANIMLSARVAPGAIKVGDFGIARAVAGSDLTATGAIIGTASYLAPEQASGRPVDHRADLYSLGCVAYRCLTGRLPWIADNELGVAMARTMRPPDPLAPACPDAPRKLVHVIEAGLARDPAARYQSATAMADALTSMRGAAIRLDRTNVVTNARPASKSVAPQPVARQSAHAAAAPPAHPDPGTDSGVSASGVGIANAAPDHTSGVTREGRTSIPSPALAPDSGRKATRPTSGRRQRRSREKRRGPRDQQSTYRGETEAARRERAKSRARAAAHSRRMQRVRRLALTVALTTIAVAVVLIGIISAGTDDSTPPDTGPAVAPIGVQDAFPFDPEGDRAENTLTVDDSFDGDLEAGWQTEAYKTREFGNLKDGVGLGFDLASIKQPRKVDVTISSGSSFELYTSNGEFREIDDWTVVPGSERTDVRTDDSAELTTVEIDTGDTEARYWLVWITELADERRSGLYFSEVSEVSFGGN